MHDLRGFLWTDFDSRGNEVPLSSITVFFDTTDLTGLIFMYGAGAGRRIGLCEGEMTCVKLGPGEVIVRMRVRLGINLVGSPALEVCTSCKCIATGLKTTLLIGDIVSHKPS